MGKQRNTFRTLTTSQLKTKSDIPTAVNISEETGYIDCTNISLSAVKSCLGESTYSLYGLCRSDDVNEWSQFGPTVRTYSVGLYPFETAVLVNSKPTVAYLGDFAGYDHVSACEPGWKTAPSAEVWVNSGSKVIVSAAVDLGDFNYPNTDSSYGLLFVLLDSDKVTVKGFETYQLNTLGTTSINVELESIDGITTDHTDWYVGAYIITDYTESDPLELEGIVQCRIPNTTLRDIDIKVKAASTLYIDGTAWNETTSQTVGNVSITGIVFNTTGGGTVFFGDIKDTTSGLTGIKISVTVENWLGSTVASGNMYDTTDYTGPSGYGGYSSGYWLVFDLAYVDPIRTFDAGSEDYTYGYTFYVTVPGYIP